MKRFLITVLISCLLTILVNILPSALYIPGFAQSSPPTGLYYLYDGKRVPLTVRQDEIGVAFKPSGGTRGESQPAYRQLQEDLQQGGTRGEAPVATVEVRPLGDRYALVKLPTNTRGDTSDLEQRVQQRPYVESTLPVLTRSRGNDAIVLPNEVIVSFQPGLTQSQQKAILERNQLEIIRPLRFTQNRYLVRSRSASGTAVLGVANRLNQVTGVQSATPNFITSSSREIQRQSVKPLNSSQSSVSAFLKNPVAQQPTQSATFQTDLLPLQWHLNSTAVLQRQASKSDRSLKNRPDLHATEAWQHSKAGEGVVVAVLDSLIQWDHPDLMGNVYTVGNVADKLPGEVHGWDFAASTSGDPDTRISDSELQMLQPPFQNTFKLSDTELQQQYGLAFAELQRSHPNASLEQLARGVRTQIRTDIVSEFHGTMTAGVIAAHAQNSQGLLGVAPNAKILPVRAGQLGGSFTSTAIVEAIGYAAHRGADVMNMSFGSMLPSSDVAGVISEVLKAHPKLVIVASSGNSAEDQLGIGFPAGVKGVVAVGATNLNGYRAPYSSYGPGLDVVAPGGDMSSQLQGGILTTSGTEADGFWQGITLPAAAWPPAEDPKGAYVWTQGTSFSAPAVAGVVALMKGEDPNRQLTRERLISLLKSTASYDSLRVLDKESALYHSLKTQSKLAPTESVQQFFFGSGLVNADKAVQAVKGK
jgi:subtilisin family serine protease